jgi:Domain of unknown function (DUF6265)
MGHSIRRPLCFQLSHSAVDAIRPEPRIYPDSILVHRDRRNGGDATHLEGSIEYMTRAIAAAALALVSALASVQAHAATLADLTFLKGNWISDRQGFVIEESWTDAQAGVVLGMSRGVQNGAVRFLRFAVVEHVGDTVVMRFKRYNADYSSWEINGPSVMRLVKADHTEAVFEATDPNSDVSRIAYRARDDGAVDVVANRKDENGPYLVEFTLRRTASPAIAQ